jgi:hypothetical protein
MKRTLITLMLASALAAGGLVRADDDDVKWINKCIADNKREGATAEVVRKYCECMNDKMGDNETQSITQWEKSHPNEMKECDAKAGWK